MREKRRDPWSVLLSVSMAGHPPLSGQPAHDHFLQILCTRVAIDFVKNMHLRRLFGTPRFWRIPVGFRSQRGRPRLMGPRCGVECGAVGAVLENALMISSKAST